MRIYQLVPSLNYGDAIGNDVLALDKLLKDSGYDSKIFVIAADHRIKEDCFSLYQDMPELNKDDLLIYHMASGSEAMKNLLQKQCCKKVMIYHNITPPEYFSGYDDGAVSSSQQGIDELRSMSNMFDCCLAVSEFNKRDLIKFGYKCPIYVLPILVPFQDYEQEPAEAVIKKYNGDGWVNWLFVGRVVPNKKQEDIIRSFAYYKKRINSCSRLFIVGNYKGMETYFDRLNAYVKLLDVTDVIFTGHTTFKEILAYYRLADVFVCMSEHEGFCVPILEAMKFRVPIVSYAAAAIPETMGQSGMLVREKNPAVVAMLIDAIIKNSILRESIIDKQLDRLNFFSYDNISRLALEKITAIINGNINGDVDPGGTAEISNDIQDNMIDIGHYNDLPFEQVPIQEKIKDDMKKNEDNVVKKYTIKHTVKVMLLKPAYQALVNVSPNIANKIRNTIYYCISKNKYAQLKQIERIKPAIIVDTTFITKNDLGTGVQRVVNNIFKNLKILSPNTQAMQLLDGKVITSYSYEGRLFNRPNKEEKVLKFYCEDKLFLLDSSWDYYKDFANIIDDLEHLKKNITTISFVHDLIPIQYPETVVNDILKEHFIGWHNLMINKMDILICNSRTTADAVCDYYTTNKFKRKKPLKLHYFHMGCDIKEDKNTEAREEIRAFVEKNSTFLMVGTVEPRKGYAIALEAFRQLISTKKNFQLLIIGKDGWKNNEFKEAVTDSLLSNNIMWVSDATDEELQWAYKNTTALIAASKVEGFGLPLVEAAQFGLPIICSDIPIFREVAGDNATYFKPMSADSLASAIVNWPTQENHPDSKKIKLFTWRESTEEILNIIDEKTKPYKILQ